MRLEGILDFSGSTIAGAVRLDRARVTGELRLDNASAGSGLVAVGADGLRVEGDAGFAGLKAGGAVMMRGAQVPGSVDLSGAQVTCPGATALGLGNAVLGGRLIGHDLQVDGELLLHDSVVTRVELAGARLHNPSGLALSGGGLMVSGGMFCTRRFTAAGTVWLVGARLGANLTLRQATLSNPGKTALNLDRAAIGHCDASALACSGQVSMAFARIASEFSLEDAQIDAGSGQDALVARGAIIEGAMRLTRLRTQGKLQMTTARIGQRLILTGAELHNPAGQSLSVSGTEVTADVFCRGAVFTGEIRMVRMRVGSHVDFDRCQLSCPGGRALDARGLQAGDLTLRPSKPIEGAVDLSHAHIGVLHDDPACWPDTLSIDGLTYLALEPQLPAAQRLNWLTRLPDGHAPQPYEQLAACYTAIGQPGQARRVLLARERRQRHGKAPLARAWNLLQDLTVAFGYQPWRALLWLTALLAAGSIVFSAAPPPPPPLQASAAPHFNAIIYTLDLLLPVIDLGQKHSFNLAGAEQWLSYFLTAAGWILATTIAAGIARVLSRR